MKVTINLTDADAEAILFSLALRSKQKNLSSHMQGSARELGEYLNEEFEKAGSWTKFDRMKNYRKPIKHVSIKCYDLAPEE